MVGDGKEPKQDSAGGGGGLSGCVQMVTLLLYSILVLLLQASPVR